MKYCVFCDAEATHRITEENKNGGSNCLVCTTCMNVYECGQASPDSIIEEIDDETEQ